MDNFLREMNNVSSRAKTSIDNSYDAIKLINVDFRRFLIQFFCEDTRKNLFITQVFYEGDNSIYNFQQYIFERTCAYLKDILNIDGLSFYFDAKIPLSSIDIVISDTKVASVNIFFKQLTLFERMFFEQIDDGISRKEKERDELQKEYDNYSNNLNNYSILNREKGDGIMDSALNYTLLRKSTKKKRLTKLDELSYSILKLENEISELMITKQMLIKNLSNVKYFQEKISSRISSNLNYRVISD